MAIEISNNCKMPIVDMSSKGDIIAGRRGWRARGRGDKVERSKGKGAFPGGPPWQAKIRPQYPIIPVLFLSTVLRSRQRVVLLTSYLDHTCRYPFCFSSLTMLNDCFLSHPKKQHRQSLSHTSRDQTHNNNPFYSDCCAPHSLT